MNSISTSGEQWRPLLEVFHPKEEAETFPLQTPSLVGCGRFPQARPSNPQVEPQVLEGRSLGPRGSTRLEQRVPSSERPWAGTGASPHPRTDKDEPASRLSYSTLYVRLWASKGPTADDALCFVVDLSAVSPSLFP